MLEGVYDTIVVFVGDSVFSAVALTGCELIGDIFKAGVWVGILAVVGVIVLVFWLIGKARK